MKRKSDLLDVGNAFLTDIRSQEVNVLSSFSRPVSPPTSRHGRPSQTKSITAQVEAGEKHVEDHLSFFSSKLVPVIRPRFAKLRHQSFVDLYNSHASNETGHHFVIHQHDHPVAGTHYDLRLQCNENSSVSWAIMYGLPGDPNSRRPNRNATETRIHCLWNHLIETASHQTGTLLLWDTGTYEILPYRPNPTRLTEATTDEDDSDTERSNDKENSFWTSLSEPAKLQLSFQNRRIRLRLHGSRLPPNYTVSLWIRSENDRTEQPPAPKTRRKKGAPTFSRRQSNKVVYDDISSDLASDSDRATTTSTPTPTTLPVTLQRSVSSLNRHESPPNLATSSPSDHSHKTKPQAPASSSSNPISHPTPPPPNEQPTPNPEEEAATSAAVSQEEIIRLNNAYPGATNSINSVHQRRWFLTMDRINSGFVKDRHSGKWVRADTDEGSNSDPNSARKVARKPSGFEPFHVLGRDHERSVVTGRLAADILSDEGVVAYVPRGKWRAITE